MPPNPPGPSQEARRSPDRRRDWSERVELAARSGDGAVEVVVGWVVADARGRGAIDVRVRRRAQRLIAVVDDDLPAAVPGRFELRAPSLWADLVVETPFEHVTFGLEAFGLVLDDGVVASADARGERVPVGLDLEFESEPDAARPMPPGDDAGNATDGGYVLACRTHGEVLVGDACLDLDGTGRRTHRWGAAPPIS